MPKPIKCCGKESELYEDVSTQEGTLKYGYYCEICQNKGASDILEDAQKEFMENANEPVKVEIDKPPQTGKSKIPKKETKPPMNQNTQLATVSRMNLADVFNESHKDLSKVMSPILSGDQNAMDRLLNNNTIRYPLTLKGAAWDKIWGNDAGQQSIIKGVEDALLLGAELGKMGDLVPFGDVCQFIPSVEAFEFALTYGNNAPFEKIKIKCIYEGDEYTSGEKDNNYFMNIDKEGMKEKVFMVSVYGKLRRTGIVEGETYSAVRLLEKAAAHSGPYKNYLKIVAAFNYQKSEGNTKIDANGREFFSYFTVKDTNTDKFFQKAVDNFHNQEAAGTLKSDSRGEYASEHFTKGKNGPWDKKLYRDELEGSKEEKIIFMDELENPYAGADQPEMLRKAAGKSFLAKYAKVRNSEAAMNEARTHEGVRDDALKMADDSIKGESEEV